MVDTYPNGDGCGARIVVVHRLDGVWTVGCGQPDAGAEVWAETGRAAEAERVPAKSGQGGRWGARQAEQVLAGIVQICLAKTPHLAFHTYRPSAIPKTTHHKALPYIHMNTMPIAPYASCLLA